MRGITREIKKNNIMRRRYARENKTKMDLIDVAIIDDILTEEEEVKE